MLVNDLYLESWTVFRRLELFIQGLFLLILLPVLPILIVFRVSLTMIVKVVDCKSIGLDSVVIFPVQVPHPLGLGIKH